MINKYTLLVLLLLSLNDGFSQSNSREKKQLKSKPILIQHHGDTLFVHPSVYTGSATWSIVDYKYLGAISESDGVFNTIKSVSQQGEGYYAAKACYDLKAYGYDDWYLPSKDEMQTLYSNKEQLNIHGGMYWSSTEVSFAESWIMDFGSTTQGATTKVGSTAFRCVRQEPSEPVKLEYRLPYLYNTAYDENLKGYSQKRSKRHYVPIDNTNRGESIHYFDKNGLNTLTEHFRDGKKHGQIKSFYNGKNQLTGSIDYSTWLAIEGSELTDYWDTHYWDSTLILRESYYEYDAKGNVIACSNQWFGETGTPNNREIMTIEYDNKGRITKKTAIDFAIIKRGDRIYYEPHSTTIAPNQQLEKTTRISSYKYIGDTTIIEKYKENILESVEKNIRIHQTEESFRYDKSRKLSEYILRSFDKKNRLILENKIDKNIILYETQNYEYTTEGLLKNRIISDLKSVSTTYLEYEYIK